MASQLKIDDLRADLSKRGLSTAGAGNKPTLRVCGMGGIRRTFQEFSKEEGDLDSTADSPRQLRMVSAYNQAGGSKRKKTYHEGRNADVDTSTVTNLHGIFAGLETNHNLLNDSSVMIGHRILDKALTLALQSQRQEELNDNGNRILDKALTLALQSQRQEELKDNGGVSAISDHLSKLINLQLINYDQVVAAVSIFELSTIAASLFLKTKDVLDQAHLVKKMVDRQAKHGKN